MADLPAYGGPPSEEVSEPSDTPTEEATEFTVKAPGEPSTGEGFEYEPMSSSPGAWVVYPPGVPCDDTQYRVTMTGPAAASDFAGMEKAIEDAGGSTGEAPESTPSSLDEEGSEY
jgi:hypothetical protein